jgi:hypothetical protein
MPPSGHASGLGHGRLEEGEMNVSGDYRSNRTSSVTKEAMLATRATGKRNQSRFAGLTKVWKSLQAIVVTTEPKPKIQEGFLEQTWRRGAKYSSTDALRALVQMERDKIGIDDCTNLTKGQRSRLLNNLRKHAEIPAAIKVAISSIETSNQPAETKTEFIRCLENLRSSLRKTYEAVGGDADNDKFKIKKSDYNHLADALFSAWNTGIGTPEERILGQLARVLGESQPMNIPPPVDIPHTIDMPQQPARVYDAKAIGELQKQVSRAGTIDQKHAEGLIKEFMQRAGIGLELLDTYVDNFMGASAISRHFALNGISKTFEATVPGWVRVWADHAQSNLKAPQAPHTALSMNNIEKSFHAQWTIHDIALRHKDASDFRAAVLQELREQTTPSVAKKFLRLLEPETFPANSYSAIVCEVIKEFARGKVS